MSRKKRKLQRRCFVFTPEMIQLTQEAMERFAQVLSRTEGQKSQPAKVAFAREMMQQVNGKLEAMSTSVGMCCLTTFDSNEKIVIATAIQLYTLDLVSSTSRSQREKQLRQCQYILQFTRDKGKRGRMMNEP